MTVEMRLNQLRGQRESAIWDKNHADLIEQACATPCRKCGKRYDDHEYLSDAELCDVRESGCWETRVCEPINPSTGKMFVSMEYHPADPCSVDFMREISS